MKEELVSIAIPAYKVSFLILAVRSALDQTYSNIEIIIVNDKSPYDVASVIKSFNDNRIRYFENEKNIGGKDLVAQWNKCLSYATGKYFCLLCDDDVYAPTFVEEMIRLTEKYSSCNVFRARAAVVDKEGNLQQEYPLSPEYETLDKYIWDVCHFRRKQTVSEFLLNTQHMRDIGGYYSIPLAWGADYVSIYRFAQNGGIASSSLNLVKFRNSGENISSEHVSNFWTKLESLQIKANVTEEIIKNSSFENKNELIEATRRYLRKQQEALISMTSYNNIIDLTLNMSKHNISLWQVVKSLVLKIMR